MFNNNLPISHWKLFLPFAMPFRHIRGEVVTVRFGNVGKMLDIDRAFPNSQSTIAHRAKIVVAFFSVSNINSLAVRIKGNKQ
jgi:hypothetical protein